MNEVEYIKSKMAKPELLAALAEESVELAQAALKLRRIVDGSNPTPVTEEEATENLLEEYGDVLNCAQAVLTQAQNNNAMKMRYIKRTRWVNRLREGTK